MPLEFLSRPHPSPASAAERAAVLADPGFGKHFTDHMAVATWTKGQGWHDAGLVPYGPFQLDPAGAVLHYGQEIFEGLKAYRHADRSVWLFRPDANARRFARSAERLGLPTLDVDDFVAALLALVRVDEAWVPEGGGEESLYLRPFMFANESFLGVRPAHNVTFAVIACPVGPYFAGGVAPVDIWITTSYSRAGTGGTGAAKCGGNYASSLVAQAEAYEHGCSQVLFTDAATHGWLEELGGMNVFLVYADGTLATPPTSGTILDGITRSSILQVAESVGLTAVERPLSLSEMAAAIEDGSVVEAFACGTAAVITPIGSFKRAEGDPLVLTHPSGEKTLALRNLLLDIQSGRAADPYGWRVRVC